MTYGLGVISKRNSSDFETLIIISVYTFASI
jgi:hypothetical protein